MIKRLGLIFLTIIALVGCTVPGAQSALVSAPLAAVWGVQQAQSTIQASATATPFQPVAPTETPTPTPTPTPKPTKTPLPQLGPAEINPDFSGGDMEPPDGQVRILLLGSDSRGDGGFRTDVIMLLAINPDGSASVISFPRDLWVFIPGWGEQRINTAFQIGGFDALAATLEYNFGVRPDHYILTNFNGFIDTIDRLDGIDVYASQELTDKCALPGKDFGYCTVEPGLNHMDGAMALWYVRSRYSTSDFDRTRRAQEVVQATFVRLMSLNGVKKAKQLYETFQDNVETDLGMGDIVPLLPLAPDLLNQKNIRRYALGPGQVWDYIIPGSGAMVLLPNQAACRELVREAMAK